MKMQAATMEQEAGTVVDARSFKETLSHWATGVTIVTAMAGEKPAGITANSLTSLSVDPPQVLISVNKRLLTHRAIINTDAFAVNILREDQVEWGKRFAGLVPEAEDRFAGIETHYAVTGSPILSDALAWMDCRVRHMYDGDDHTIFVGEVVATRASHSGQPLLYYDRAWRRLGE